MNRGAERKNIFFNDQDKKLFIEILIAAQLRYKIEIHAYCVMSNHYHLLIRTPIANLSKVMQHLNSVYTQGFNRMKNKDGALFRGRYKAILVEEEDYLLCLTRYIHFHNVGVSGVSKAYHQFHRVLLADKALQKEIEIVVEKIKKSTVERLFLFCINQF